MVIDNIVGAPISASSETTEKVLYHQEKKQTEKKTQEQKVTKENKETRDKPKETKRVILQGDTLGKPKEQKYELQSLTFIPPALVFSYDKGMVIRNFYNEMNIRNVQGKTHSLYSAPTSRKLLTVHEAAKEDIGFLWN